MSEENGLGEKIPHPLRAKAETLKIATASRRRVNATPATPFARDRAWSSSRRPKDNADTSRERPTASGSRLGRDKRSENLAVREKNRVLDARVTASP